MRIGCARCHDHPLDRWRRADHLGFAAFFADARPDPGGGMRDGKLFDPETGSPVAPRLLPLCELEADARLEPRAQLAAWILDAANDAFPRNIANRVFAALLGRGLVEPPDDHRLTNPPVMPELLAELTAILCEAGGDLRALVVAIAGSRLYASDSLPGTGDARRERAELRYFARREARPLAAKQLAAAVAAVLGVPDPHGLRLPRSPLARQLALLNGPLLDRALAAGGTTVDALLDFGGTPAEQLDAMFRTILSRPPRDAERERFLALLAASDARAGARDLARALLASREFGSLR